jgi:hypothetical protein
VYLIEQVVYGVGYPVGVIFRDEMKAAFNRDKGGVAVSNETFSVFHRLERLRGAQTSRAGTDESGPSRRWPSSI